MEFEIKNAQMVYAVTFSFCIGGRCCHEFALDCTLSEFLHADDLVLISWAVEGFRDVFLKWKEAFVSKGLKVNLGMIKVVVSGITQVGLSKSKVDQYEVCSLRVKANSVLCAQCCRCIHGKCADVNG